MDPSSPSGSATGTGGRPGSRSASKEKGNEERGDEEEGTGRPGPSRPESGTGEASADERDTTRDDSSSPSEKSQTSQTSTLPASPRLLAEAEQILRDLEPQRERVPARPLGFRNTGSQTCYRNSVISMLLNIPKFSKWLHLYLNRQRTLMHEVPQMNLKANTPVTSALAWVNDTYNKSGDAAVRQSELDADMGDFFDSFVNAEPGFTIQIDRGFWRQEDAEEFLSRLLSRLEEELTVHAYPVCEVLEELFTFYLVEDSSCLQRCQRKKVRSEETESGKVRRLHVAPGSGDGERHETYQECLQASFRREMKKFCDQCQKRTRHRCRQTFVKLPKILLTSINRNTQDQANQRKVALKYSKRGNRPRYRLVGVVGHEGLTGHSGHNISYVPNQARPGKWCQLDDETVTDVEMADINRFNAKKGTRQSLPFIVAWELTNDAAVEADEKFGSDKARDENERVKERERALDEREKALDQMQEGVEQARQAHDNRERIVKKAEKKVRQKNRESEAQKAALDGQKEFLGGQKEALDQREETLRQQTLRQQDHEGQADDRVDEGQDGATVGPVSSGPTAQLERQLEEGKDTATFCATFRNADDHHESGRAIFKVEKFPPKMPIRIESTVQLSDLEGRIRPIKKGTNVTDRFLITFNAKGGQKRKRGADDADDDEGNDGNDNSGDGPPPPKRTKASSKKTAKTKSGQSATSGRKRKRADGDEANDHAGEAPRPRKQTKDSGVESVGVRKSTRTTAGKRNFSGRSQR